jgi:hypothetical protein
MAATIKDKLMWGSSSRMAMEKLHFLIVLIKIKNIMRDNGIMGKYLEKVN